MEEKTISSERIIDQAIGINMVLASAERLLDTQMKKSKLEFIRDLFLFCTFTGLVLRICRIFRKSNLIKIFKYGTGHNKI